MVAEDQLTSLPVQSEDIHTAVDFYSAFYGVSTSTLNRVITCESNWDQYATGDDGHSRGLVQIYDLYHPEITDAERLNPYFSINYLASKISEGHGNLWSCYKKKKGGKGV